MSTANSIRAGAAFIEIFIKDQVSVGLEKINKSLLSFSAKAGLAGAAIGAGGLAILRPLISAGSEFAEFDRRIRATGAASELTKSQMDKLGEELKRVAQLRGTVLLDLADETVELARALGKVDPSQLADLADVVAQLAKASGGTLATSRAGLLSTLGAFGLGISQAKDVANLLVKGANTSQADLSDFVFTLKTLAPVAKTAGISIQTTIALASALSTIGIKGEEAGTQLRRLAVDVTANTAELEKAFNIKIPKGTTFAGVLEQLNIATKNDDVTTRLSKFNKAFGLLGITSALGLGTTAEQVKKFQESFVDISGELQKQFDLIQGGLGGGFDRLSASFSVLRVTIGGALEGLFGAFRSAIQSVNEVLSPFIKNNKEVVEVLLLVGIGAVAAGAALAAMAVSSIALSLVIGSLTSILGLFASLLGVVFTPIGATLLAISAVVLSNVVAFGSLGIAFLALTKTGNRLAKSMGQGVIAAFKAVKKAVGEILGTVKMTMEGVSLAIRNGDLEGAARIAFLGLKIAALQAFKFVVNVAKGALANILNAMGISGDYAEIIVTRIVNNIFDLVSIISNAVVTVISYIDNLLGNLEKRIGNLGAILQGLALGGALGPLAQALAAKSLGGKPNSKAPPSALDKLLEENQKKLKELIDLQKAKQGVEDPKLGDKLAKSFDAAVGGGVIPDAVDKNTKSMVSSSFDSTRGLIKGRANAGTESLKSIAGSTKEMVDILRNGTIRTAPATGAGMFGGALNGAVSSSVKNQVQRGKNTLTDEREARLREKKGREDPEGRQLFFDIRNIRRIERDDRAKAQREKRQLEQEQRDELFRNNRPFNSKANIEDLNPKVNAAVEKADKEAAAKSQAVNARINDILKSDQAKRDGRLNLPEPKQDIVEPITEGLNGLEGILEAIRAASVSQFKVLEKIAEKEGSVFV